MSNELDVKGGPSKRLIPFLMVLFVLTLGIGIGTLISYRVGAIGPGDSQLTVQSGTKPIAGDAALSLSKAFQEVAARVEPAVVNINTEEVVNLSQRRTPEGGDDQMEDMFRRFFGTPNMPRQFTRRSLGSGVIVDPKGYIITNDHVVSGASRIKVTLADGSEYMAKIVATDPLSDIGVIKIERNEAFPATQIGDATALQVGDWVLAIGSPFGLEQTVTAGIISATGRVFPTEAAAAMTSLLFNDFIQTDAAINVGNSGGPLVNLNGEVVGINTFISTRSGSNSGVGFSVPSHIFVNVYNQILEKGKVARGYLGVSMNLLPFTSEMAEYFGVQQGGGVLITTLSDQEGDPSSNSPAAKAGIKAEDVIVEFDGKKILTVEDLRLAVANTPPGSGAKVRVVRFGKEMTFDVTLVERTLEAQQAEDRTYSFEEPEKPKAEIGFHFVDLPGRLIREFDLSGGALVQEVEPGSLAEQAGLQGQDRRGFDVIIEVNGVKIEDANGLFAVVKKLNSGGPAVIKFLRIDLTTGAPTTSTLYTSFVKP